MLWLPFRGRINGYAINRREWNNAESEKGNSSGE
jgi:hypothetical protein